MMAQLQAVQEQMAQTQAALADETVEASVGGGMVKVVASGQQDILSISIQPEVVDPDDVEMLEDLILSAVTEALERSRKLSEERMGGLTAGLDLPPGLL
jgi:DNA-binding YbaB/EbfC family protein